MPSDTPDILTPAQRFFSRRSFVRRTGLGVLGLSLADFLFLERAARAEDVRPQAKNVLVILEQGGLSHIDTWDPKPDLAVDSRSPYKSIPTRVPGLQFTELLAK